MATLKQPIEDRIIDIAGPYFPGNLGYKVHAMFNPNLASYIVRATYTNWRMLGGMAHHADMAFDQMVFIEGDFNPEIVDQQLAQLSWVMHAHIIKNNPTFDIPLGDSAVEALLEIAGLKVRGMTIPALGYHYLLVKPGHWAENIPINGFRHGPLGRGARPFTGLPEWDYDRWREFIAARVRAGESHERHD
jgi:hypothetical protein